MVGGVHRVGDIGNRLEEPVAHVLVASSGRNGRGQFGEGVRIEAQGVTRCGNRRRWSSGRNDLGKGVAGTSGDAHEESGPEAEIEDVPSAVHCDLRSRSPAA